MALAYGCTVIRIDHRIGKIKTYRNVQNMAEFLKLILKKNIRKMLGQFILPCTEKRKRIWGNQKLLFRSIYEATAMVWQFNSSRRVQWKEMRESNVEKNWKGIFVVTCFNRKLCWVVLNWFQHCGKCKFRNLLIHIFILILVC